MKKVVSTRTVNHVEIDEAPATIWRPKVKGKRCGCFDDEERDPTSVCHGCFGTGIVARKLHQFEPSRAFLASELSLKGERQ